MNAKYMEFALNEAKKAALMGEVPIGAVVVMNGKIIASAHNLCESLKDPTAHAEILAMKKAAEVVGDFRLKGAELYVTLEPCAMCAGAAINARVSE
ncbi:MAG: nucleoside deaminase, partial [Clostridia bacterium]|nr:nucleoside deaminase [Clostridia bacterium]